MSKNPTITSRSRHNEVSYYFVRELVNRGVLKIEYIPSGQQFADGFTKSLGTYDFMCHRKRHKLILLSTTIFPISYSLVFSLSNLWGNVKEGRSKSNEDPTFKRIKDLTPNLHNEEGGN